MSSKQPVSNNAIQSNSSSAGTGVAESKNEDRRRDRSSPVEEEEVRSKTKKRRGDSVDSATSDSCRMVTSPEARNSKLISSLGKTTWKMSKVPVRCHTVIIGDSNLLRWDKSDRIHILAFTGSHILDIARLILEWQIPSHVKNIVVAAGFDNHINDDNKNMRELEELFETVRVTKDVTVYAMEVAVLTELSESSKQHLDYINGKLFNQFTDRFIQFQTSLAFVDASHYTYKSGHDLSHEVFAFLQ